MPVYRLCAILVLLTVGCATNSKSEDRTVLRVALFPYIPDAAKDQYRELLRRIKDEFERGNPSVTLVMRPLDQNEDFYDVGQIAKMLAGWDGEPPADLVEIDTLLLTDLKNSGLIQEWPKWVVSNDWHRAAKEACTIKGNDSLDHLFAIPHWLCGHFVITRDPAIAQAGTAADLVKALKTANSTVHLSACFTGSWNLPCLYMDAWADTHQEAPKPTVQLDPAVMASLKQVCQEVARGNRNPGLDKSFGDDYPDAAADEFAEGKSNAFIGYSERLYVIVRDDKVRKPLYLRSAPLGNGSKPLVFVDGLALRNGVCPRTVDAARRFTEFMNRPETFEWLLLSQDAGPKGIPRYLLPASISAYNAAGLAADPYYQKLKSELAEAIPYPNSGTLEMRRGMQELLFQYLTTK